MIDQVIVNNRFTYTETKGECKYIYIYSQQQYIIIFTSQYSQICLINSSISEFAHGIFCVENFWMAHTKPS